MKQYLNKGVAGFAALAMVLGLSITTALGQVNGQNQQNRTPQGQQEQQQNQSQQNQNQQVQQNQSDQKNEIMELLGQESTQLSVDYMNNGAKMTISAGQNDSSTLNGLAGRINNGAQQMTKNTSIQVSAQQSGNNLVITATSSKPEEVKIIQNTAKMAEIQKKLADQGVDIKSNMSADVQNIDKGVRVSVTSDNQDIQQMIRLMADNMRTMGINML